MKLPYAIQYGENIIIHMSKPIEYTIPKVNPQCKAWSLCDNMCQYRFIDCNKCAMIVEDIDNGGYAYEGTGYKGILFVISFHLNFL